MSEELGIKQKIMLDLFVTPMTMIPSLGGLTMMLGGWAIGSPRLMFMGVMGCLVAAAAGLWRFMFNFKDVTEASAKKIKTKELMAEEAELDALDRKLVKNKDPRDQKYLRNLRAVYKGFITELNDGKLSAYVTSSMISEVNDMFKYYVGLLDESYKTWERSRNMKGKLKKTLLKQRDEILDEVEKNVAEFADTISRLRALTHKENSGVSDAQKRLVQQLEIAERTQARMKDLNADENERFAEFTQEAS